jgi:hypothetical protein
VELPIRHGVYRSIVAPSLQAPAQAASRAISTFLNVPTFRLQVEFIRLQRRERRAGLLRATISTPELSCPVAHRRIIASLQVRLSRVDVEYALEPSYAWILSFAAAVFPHLILGTSPRPSRKVTPA